MPPGIDGIELLKLWKKEGLLNFPVAIISGYADVKSAVKAMEHGAIDVLAKPVDRKRIESLVRQAQTSVKKNIFDHAIRDIELGTSRALIKIKGEMLKALNTGGAISFIAKRGHGSEFFASLLNAPGKRWVSIYDHRQLEKDLDLTLTKARNGTIYVRRLGNISESQQQGLMQLIRKAPNYTVRVIIESEQPLDELNKEGKISDLLLKLLKPGIVTVPPMESFTKDIDALLKLAVQRHCQAIGLSSTSFDDGALRSLVGDGERWLSCGLDMLIGFARILIDNSTSGAVSAEQVQDMLTASNEMATGTSIGKVSIDEDVFAVDLREARDIFERLYFTKLLERVGHNVQEASKLSGLERTYLYRKVKTLLGPDALKNIQ